MSSTSGKAWNFTSLDDCSSQRCSTWTLSLQFSSSEKNCKVYLIVCLFVRMEEQWILTTVSSWPPGYWGPHTILFWEIELRSTWVWNVMSRSFDQTPEIYWMSLFRNESSRLSHHCRQGIGDPHAILFWEIELRSTWAAQSPQASVEKRCYKPSFTDPVSQTLCKPPFQHNRRRHRSKNAVTNPPVQTLFTNPMQTVVSAQSPQTSIEKRCYKPSCTNPFYKPYANPRFSAIAADIPRKTLLQTLLYKPCAQPVSLQSPQACVEIVEKRARPLPQTP